MISAIYLRNILNCGSIIREDEVDTVYLLAKELAYDVVTGQTDNLAAALAKTSGKDIVQFANAVEISHSSIGKEICKTKSAGKDSSQKSQYAMYKESTDIKSTTLGGTALCGDKGFTTGSNNISNGHSETPQFLGHFVAKTLKDGNLNWPTSKHTGSAVQKSEQNDNAKAVAEDLTKLTLEEKTIVAGLLAKTIEGGEVVEIRAVSSTFRESLTMQSSEVTFEYSVKYRYVHYI
ncbi:hypothetical protein P029_04095 [Anaplasma phagocytophilum str. Norway variant2]|uniref:Uncharacterized protein n=1 Tax=Anaplasma phagocytophilum str. Norway variant2 TaxID=1392507 RepID=A0A168HFR3_ANAPH|nr:hypothetical protein P029_04095 [Anaplasma phagocytophilum str. Norway variant2]